jgi:hypothetical protein
MTSRWWIQYDRFFELSSMIAVYGWLIALLVWSGLLLWLRENRIEITVSEVSTTVFHVRVVSETWVIPWQPCASKPLPRNGRPLRLYHSCFQAFWHTRRGNVLSEALPSNGLFLFLGVMSQYRKIFTGNEWRQRSEDDTKE